MRTPSKQEIATFPRYKLAHLPTPLEQLKNLSAFLKGPQIFVKRDDCTGLATGGNKTRKLEFLIADALNKGATVLVTEGGMQSNHVRQTAAAACKARLKCTLVVDKQVPWQQDTYKIGGNLFLDQLLGADIRICAPDQPRSELISHAVQDLKSAGETPYFIPLGGSCAIGGLGYALCAHELIEQAAAAGTHIDHVLFATSSGGTQGGFLAGLDAARSNIRCQGIEIDKDIDNARGSVTSVYEATAGLLGQKADQSKIHIAEGYAAPGYGMPNKKMVDAVSLVATLEGLLLDPVYSGKAMAGLIDLVQKGAFANDENIVFVHTGGTPALFAYTDAFQSQLS